jgi:hypothetical protein
MFVLNIISMGASKATLRKDLRADVSRKLEEVFKDLESLV